MAGHHFDALIITALLDELEAVLAFGAEGRASWTTERDSDGFPFHHREFQREDGGGTLRIAAASFDEMGPSVTAARASALIKELDPACLAMCGICAGKKADVALGDVIVADRVYHCDYGKLLAWRDKDGYREEELLHDTTTYNLKSTWRVDAAYFARETGWAAELVKTRPLSLEVQKRWLLRALLAHELEGVVAPDEHPERDTYCPSLDVLWDRLRQPEHDLLVQTPGELALTAKGRGLAKELKRKYRNGLPKDRDFKIHVGPIATGHKVQKDPELFERLARIGRRTLGAEMEAAAIGMVGEQFDRRAIIVKAVSDYGDHDKDDAFRQFATRASAEVLLRFLLRQLEPSAREVRIGPDSASALPFTFTGALGGDNLLVRIQQITELQLQAQGATARIQWRSARPPLGGYLDVSKMEGPFNRLFPVAAVHQVTPDVLNVFLNDVDALYRRRDRYVASTLVYDGDPPTVEVQTQAAERGILLQSFTEYQRLIDFREYLRLQVDRLERDPIYPPALYVEQRAIFPAGAGGEREPDDALGELFRQLKSPYGRFILVLGDFGTGKTFLLHELARRMALEGGALVPVLIELRALNKALQLDTLIAQHLSEAGNKRIDLAAFRYLLAEGRIALLFDGFDELALRVTYEQAADHFETLLQAAQGQAKVVVTSRTQHFLSDQQVMSALMRRASDLQGFQLVKLQPFTEERIQRFLMKRLGNEEEARARFQLLDEVKNLLGLSENPRMLGFIANIPVEELRKVKERDKEITSASLYEMLLTQWLKSEFERAHPRGSPPGLTLEQRWKAVIELAKRLWHQTERSINIDRELPEETVKAVRALEKLELDAGVLKHQIGSGTLLVRDEEDRFSFIHQSVMEWLVARAVADELMQDGGTTLLGMQEISPLMADFVWGLAGKAKAEQWAQDVLVHGATDTVQKNALLLLKQMGVTARSRLYLAGKDLRGQDLSGKDLSHGDHTEAILTDVLLVGADLTGAKLVRANLRRADLTNARLNEADLQDVDLRDARLLGARLQRANLRGASLSGAKLLGARFTASALDGADMYGAALPRGRLEPMVSADSPCYSIAVSPDGRWLASGHAGTIRIWHIETGQALRVLHGHEDFVKSVAFSSDGKTLASGSFDGTVRLWDVVSGAEHQVLRGHSNRVYCVALSLDGKTLASGSEDNTVRIWDMASGLERQVLRGHSRSVWGVTFSPDGRMLASSSFDRTVRLWNVVSGSELRVLKGHSSFVYCAAFSLDGMTLASSSEDKTVRLWDVASGSERDVLEGHSHGVLAVAFSSDGRMLASGSEDNTVRLWDVTSASGRQVLEGHSNSVWGVTFSSDSKMLASGSADGTVRLWDMVSGSERRILRGHSGRVWGVTFSSDSKVLASSSEDGTVRLWDVAWGAERRVLRGHSDSIWGVAFSPDGKALASGSFDKTVRLWDVAWGSERRILKGHSNNVYCVTFSSNGKTLASGSADRTVRLWDVASGAELRILEGHSNSVYGVAFSPNSRTLASGSVDSTVRLWNVASGSKRRVLKGHSDSVWSVAFSSNGKTLASGSFDRTVRLWDVASGSERRVLKGHSNSVYSVAFSPGGKTLASGSADNTVRLWDVASGSERRVLKGHSNRIWSVAFSPDGKLLASGSVDGTVRLWNVVSGRCLAILVSLPEGWVAFTPDGRFRSAGSLNGAFWHVMGLCRFEPEEADPFLSTPLRVYGEPLYRLPG